MELLNKDCLCEIFKYLDIFDIFNCALSCKKCLNIINVHQLWKAPLLENFYQKFMSSSGHDNFVHYLKRFSYQFIKTIYYDMDPIYLDNVFISHQFDEETLLKILKELLYDKNITITKKNQLNSIFRNQYINSQMIDLCKDFTISWTDYVQNKHMDEEIVSQNINNFNSNAIDELSCRNKLSIQFLTKHEHLLEWYLLSSYVDLTIEIGEKFSSKLHWNFISEREDLNTDFILKFYRYLNWEQLVECGSVDNIFLQHYIGKAIEYKNNYPDEYDEN